MGYDMGIYRGDIMRIYHGYGFWIWFMDVYGLWGNMLGFHGNWEFAQIGHYKSLVEHGAMTISEYGLLRISDWDETNVKIGGTPNIPTSSFEIACLDDFGVPPFFHICSSFFQKSSN